MMAFPATALLRTCMRPSVFSAATAIPSIAAATSAVQPTAAAAAASTLAGGRRRRRKKGAEARREAASYQFRPPRHYRGPYHPIQPPPPADPASREFAPGPFGSERLHDHYHNTLAPDLLALTYDHLPFGYERPEQPPRLRSWDDSSPYYKNRPLRGPRGGDALRLLTPPRTFRNVPMLTGITVHSMCKGALQDPDYIAAAGMAVQSITGVRATVCYSKHHIAPWGLKEDKPIAVKVYLRGMQAWRFLSSCVDVVMPRIKDYKGVKGSSGDSSGNITFGFKPEELALFPEIEVNYDMYPPKMIPGCHVTVHTSATNDKDARLLLTSFGVPFYGRLVN